MIHFGAAYYPEYWPEEHWPEDIRLMREAGFTVVRLAGEIPLEPHLVLILAPSNNNH